jgi:hypothetical protein
MNPPHRDHPSAPIVERIGEDGVAYVETTDRGSWEDHQRSRSYPRSLDLLIGAVSIFVLWISVLVTIVSLAMKWSGRDQPWGTVSLVAMSVLGVSLVFSLCYSLTRKCPLCHGTPLHSRFCRKHRLASRWPGLTYRFTTVLCILTSLSFRCMYCGTPFRLFKKSSRLRR